MTFTESIETCFSKYADFNGCASRSEFWRWALFVWAVGFVLVWSSLLLFLVFSLGTLIPYVAVATRRLHDTDRSGWWQLLALVPVLGWIALLAILALEGEPASRYAAVPEAAPV
jgi:uncharacterized membrane protein YhaH (DUF805 family)